MPDKVGRKPRVEPDFPGKRCRRCGKFTRMEDFLTPRTKQCIPCQVRQREASQRFQLVQAKLSMRENLTPGLTSTREGTRAYQNARYRSRMKPTKPPLFLTPKLCRRCQRVKPVTEFGSHRIRICLACDGPDLETLLRNPQRTK
jgi:hypothetical protein